MLRASLFLLAGLLAAPALAQHGEPSAERRRVEAEQYLVRGMTRAYIGDHAGAVELYERALSLTPDEAAILAALAEAHEAQGDLTSALFFAGRVVELAPEEPSGYRHLAALQLAVGDTDGAVGTYERLLAAEPRDLGALTALARIQQQSGRFAEALATYERVLERVGEHGAVRARMLTIYQRLGDAEGAIEALEALVALDPANGVLRRQLAELVRAEGDAGRADALLGELGPDPAGSAGRPAEAPLDDAQALYRAGDWAGAAEALARALADDPLHPPAWAQLALAHLRAGNPNAALDAADEALLLFPGQYDLVVAAALAHAEAGRAPDARRLFGEALAILSDEAPEDDGERHYLLAQVGLLDGRLDEALEDARRAVEVEPENPAYLATLGRVHAARAEHADAVAWLTKAVEAGERTAGLLEDLGDAEAARGRTDAARRHWQDALDLAPKREQLRNKLGGAP